ncbi:unnamed protein product [Arctogadus glacialis]
MTSASPAPCDPENVQASLDCSSGVCHGDLDGRSWSVPYYTVVASASGQPELSVQTNVTSCGLDRLRCGAEYTVLSHEMLLNCSSTQALVAWAPDAHATSFSVSARPAGPPRPTAPPPPTPPAVSWTGCLWEALRRRGCRPGEDRCPSAPSTSFEILQPPAARPTSVPSYTCGSRHGSAPLGRGARGRASAPPRAQGSTRLLPVRETHCSLLSLCSAVGCTKVSVGRGGRALQQQPVRRRADPKGTSHPERYTSGRLDTQRGTRQDG